MDRHLHIVSFDVPSPPDYGGVIDVYYKAKALADLGVRIHLHCFTYGRKPAPELEEFCEEVHYYQRRTSKHLLLSNLPYVVVSRRNEELLDRLLLDDHPILFEGLHACYFLGDTRLQGRKRTVRAHNVEHEYYAALAQAERSPFRRAYFIAEARKLERFEPVLSEADGILAISPNDQAHFRKRFNCAQHVPAFHACGAVSVPPGLGDFALYHGALSVPENDQAAIYLVREVFNELAVRLVIAGSGASSELKALVERTPNVELLEDITTEQIHSLVRDAQVNVLPTFQATGIKLKLLLCLFSGRHVVCNSPMVAETGLEELCMVHDRPEQMRLSILACMGRPANGATLEKRLEVLEQRFDNRRNAQYLAELVC